VAVRPSPRLKRPDDEPQQQRQEKDINYRADAQVLKQVSARIVPPPSDTDYPGTDYAEGKVPVIES
jgi:hypothetical protein